MRYLSFISLFYFVGSFMASSYAAPFTIPYRYPTHSEYTNNQNILISSQPITESDIFIERGVLEYLVANNFLKQRWLNKWNQLNQLTTLTPRQAIRMTRTKRAESKALRRFQRANRLPVTGIIDSPVISIVFPVACGTPDYVDEPFNDGFGDYEEIVNATAPGNLTGAFKKK
mgnify:CR=1 FL=1|jgi:hypothetical protein